MLKLLGKGGGIKQSRNIAVMVMLALALLLAQGCATKTVSGTGDERTPQEERIGEPVIQEIAPPDLGDTASRTSPAVQAELAARNSSGLAKESLTDVLFDFDRAHLRLDVLPALEATASRLKADGVKRVLLEGRGDEVGTAAYNLVLGERRAKSVKSYLQQLGLSIDLKTTSYGKDRPLCFDHGSDCRQRNRSVHFVVKE
jgi:peptidoglycan-associated lipoprotein